MRVAVSIIILVSFATHSRIIALGGEAESGMPGTQPSWEATYQQRLNWWSLQPLAKTAPPSPRNHHWARTDVDRFILAALEAKGIEPAPEADKRTLVRRLSYALTGLPPQPDTVEKLAACASPNWFEVFVDSLLASPQFGERWARHWMDVVHYSDTHGYEWDTPAKNSWRYRDYLVRAFNGDLPIKRFILEQIAGDLLEPRIDPASRLNESMIGPMALRLGERRHGDNAAVEGVTQEAVANMIDTVSKGFLATTVACAQCHDHKLDAIAQRDYYALAGIFMSSRWGVRSADAADPNLLVIDELRRIKQRIHEEIAKAWLNSAADLKAKIQALPLTNKFATNFPESVLAFWQRSQTNAVTREEFRREREKRIAENKANLTLLADFTREDGTNGWRWDGFGMKHGLVRDGEIVIAEEGNKALLHLLPAGRWSHAWSMRLAGAVSSPLFNSEHARTFSVGFAGGKHAAQSFIVDNAFHCERMKFFDQPRLSWLTLKAGDFDTLEGSIDRVPRRVYLELVTKSLNNYFPPRTAYSGLKESDLAEERSWFGVTRIYQHPPGKTPRDELTRFAPLFADEEMDWATRIANLLSDTVERWSRGECDSESVRLLNEALETKLLPNDLESRPALAKLVTQYRTIERKLQPDRAVGSAADWNEARDERIAVRGSYTDFGDEVPRGTLRWLRADEKPGPSSGRLEFAQSIANDRNPLTARVFVNRVWLYLFGEGLVRTPDDFGHLGMKPSHPELLDFIAARFVEEGWSLKQLIRMLVNSSTWRQSSKASNLAMNIDPENRLWHHRPMRRLEAEAIRDSILAVSGRLDTALSGPAIDPYRTAEDAAKRLFSGPLDGNGRRSLYIKMTMMEPPRFLALFNQPIPKLTTGRRDLTSVPDQALALLNDPFVIAMAKHWSERLSKDGTTSPEERTQRMFATALGRPARPEETKRLVALAERTAKLRGADPSTLMDCQPAWQDVAHAIFNLKEFIYVP